MGKKIKSKSKKGKNNSGGGGGKRRTTATTTTPSPPPPLGNAVVVVETSKDNSNEDEDNTTAQNRTTYNHNNVGSVNIAVADQPPHQQQFTATSTTTSATGTEDAGDITTSSTIERRKPPPRGVCEICCLTLPVEEYKIVYKGCCGKIICGGCIHENRKHVMAERGQWAPCPYCREPPPESDKSILRQWRKRIERHEDPEAMYNLGVTYRDGTYGQTKVPAKAVRLFRRASDLGHPESAFCLAILYGNGYPEGGIPQDPGKFKEFLEVAAYQGANLDAWYNLGNMYLSLRNFEDSTYHFRTSAAYGLDVSLEMVTSLHKLGIVTKDDFATTLREWQAAKDDTASDARKAADEEWLKQEGIRRFEQRCDVSIFNKEQEVARMKHS